MIIVIEIIGGACRYRKEKDGTWYSCEGPNEYGEYGWFSSLDPRNDAGVITILDMIHSEEITIIRGERNVE